MDELWSNNDYRYYLAHHGILGQKWGHKNGPPYPLDAGDHSASEKKAGWKKSLGGVFKKKPNLDDLKDNKLLKKTLAKNGVEDPEEAIKKSVDAGKKMAEDINNKYFNDSESDKPDKDKAAKEAAVKEATKDCWEPDLKKDAYRAIRAADLGLEAINKVRGDGYVDQDELNDIHVKNSRRAWFLVDDQTIGLPMIADLVNQGYSAEKISKMIDTVNENYSDLSYDMQKNIAVSNIRESNFNNENKRFAVACDEIRNPKKYKNK